MKFDVKAAENEYITTNTSYRKLAEKYEVDQSTIVKYAKRDGWVEKRKQYQAKVQQKSYEKAMQQDIDKLSKLKEATDSVISVAVKRAAKYTEDDCNAQELKQFASALKDLVCVQRDLHGIINDDRNSKRIVVEIQGDTDKWSQ